MIVRAAALFGAACAVVALAIGGSSADQTSAVSVQNPARAQMNYMLNCQGCHLADGRGMAGKVPNMAGEVGRFLKTPGGRAYLSRVPGVTNAALSDADLADVMNWTLASFDPAGVPDGFKPYTAEDMAAGRARGLSIRAEEARGELLKALAEESAADGDY
ncbi:MAG: cytochrome C [Pseudomonadota bacterium]